VKSPATRGTMAFLPAAFLAFGMLAAAASPAFSSEVVLYASKGMPIGDWVRTADATAVGGFAIRNKNDAEPDRPVSPNNNYVERTFRAEGGVPHYLWFRMKAENNSAQNDSVWVQFSGTVNGAGAPIYRIGSTSAIKVILQSCNGAAMSNWGWRDAGWCGVQGAAVVFASSGIQTIRVLQRQDGVSIDQVVISSSRFAGAAPGPFTSDNTFLAEATGLGLSTIKAVQWNVEDGQQAGEITAIVAQKPHVVFLQEIDRVAHLDSMVAALESDQGVDWHRVAIERHNTTTGASFVAILARFPLSNVKTTALNSENEVICGVALAARAAIGARILVEGKPLAVFSTRNTFVSGDCPAREQNRRMKAWAESNYRNVTHLYGGDFNMIPGRIAYTVMTQEAPRSIDVWEEARARGTAAAVDHSVAFNTPTRNNRLDYLFYKNGPATLLSTSSGRIPTLQPLLSDHRMMIAIFTVRP
jgi:endonuclease/exonuclease/phosphatase family metal-dependent hydrolase